MINGIPMRAEEIAPGTCTLGNVEGRAVAIFNVDGELYAVQNACTHMTGPLCEGSLWGDVVQCPWHGSEFNVRTGEVVSGPAELPLQTYRVEIIEGVLVLSSSGPETPATGDEGFGEEFTSRD